MDSLRRDELYKIQEDHDFIQAIYGLVTLGVNLTEEEDYDIDDAGYNLYMRFDDLFHSGHFNRADTLMTRFDLSKFGITMCLALLGATKLALGLLPSRQTVANNVLSRLRQLGCEDPVSLIEILS